MSDFLKSSGMRAGRSILRRVTKPIPIIGTVVVLATAYGVLRRKGVFPGSVDVALDSIPFVGAAKGLIELVRGDFIPDRVAPSTGDRKAKGGKNSGARAA